MRYSCLPSALLAEDATMFRMLAVLARYGPDEEGGE